jgi:hypothetical protein
MKIEFRRGYNVFSKPGDIAYVALHAGPALEIPTSRDENTETVASLCWFKTGGKLVISSLPRKKAFGIDFNRGIPPKKEAISLFEGFSSGKDEKRLYEYRKKYAWSAKDQQDYSKRLSIYRSFWNEIKRSDFIVLVHRCFTRLKNVPTLMDFTSFDGKGVDIDVLKSAVEEVNRKNSAFFKSIEKEYKALIMLDEERAIQNIKRIFGSFVLNKLRTSDFEDNLAADIKAMEKYCPKPVFKKLMDDFTPENFLYACKKALEKIETPRATVEHVFHGLKSIGPRKQLFPSKRKVLNIESTAFMNFWYPHKTAEIITDIIERVKNNSK